MGKGSGIDRPRAANSLVELARQRAAYQPERIGYTFLHDEAGRRTDLSYGELHGRAAKLAERLAAAAPRGERALLLPPGIEYVVAFYACLYAGIVAVPIYPATSRRRVRRLCAVIDDSAAAIAITTAALLPRLQHFLADIPLAAPLHWLTADPTAAEDEVRFAPGAPAADEIAFLQYTPGSTAAPKGVMVSHGNLWHNSASIQQAYGWTADSVTLSWLPPYHDMGLIGGILQPMYSGCHSLLMSPESFMQWPYRWLKAISDHQATISGGPNFAFDLCVRQIRDDQLKGLNLSSWQVAPNGAEPVVAATLDAFVSRFAAAGFSRTTLFPCYGLAETTLMVSGGPHSSGPCLRTVDRERLLTEQVAVAATDAAAPSLTLVASGRPVAGFDVAIVDPDSGEPRAPGVVGEICVAGPSVALGYWRNPAETARVFDARVAGFGDCRFLRTGDLGFLHEGQLYVSGRMKDMIIVRGRNLYPQDIEQASARSHPALRHACAAFAVDTPCGESLAIVQEIDSHHPAPPESIFAAIGAAVADDVDVQPARIALVRAGRLPLTSSGKIQRSACRSLFEAGELDAATLAAAAPDALLVDYLRAMLAHTLGAPVDALDADTPLPQLGLDSLGAVGLG